MGMFSVASVVLVCSSRIGTFAVCERHWQGEDRVTGVEGALE